MKKTGLTECVYDYYVQHRTLNISDVTNIYKYLMKKKGIK